MAASDLTTLANVREYVSLNDPSLTTDDALLSRLITAASGFISNWCNRSFTSQTFNDVRDGTGARRMPFSNYPVSAVSSVTIDGQSIPAGDAVSTPGYFFSPTMLMLNGYSFSRGLGNVRMTYTAGLLVIPPELEQACIELVGFRYREISRIGVASKGNAGETTAYVIRDMPPSVAVMLAQFKKVVPV